MDSPRSHTIVISDREACRRWPRFFLGRKMPGFSAAKAEVEGWRVGQFLQIYRMVECAGGCPWCNGKHPDTFGL